MGFTAILRPLLVCTLLVLVAAQVKNAPRGPAFSCRGRSPGYYADLDTNCQDYHMCDAGGRRYTYSCPNQTRFQQRVMICDHWFMVDCSLSESHFDANLLIGQQDRQFVGEDEERDEPFNRIPSPPYEGKKTFPPSPTKKILDEKSASVKYTETKFVTSVPTKPSTGKGLPREFAGNPFFSSLTQAPSAATSKGERGSLTFRQTVAAQGVSSLPQKPRASFAPSPSTPTLRQDTPTTLPNREERKPSTTAQPSSRDFGFVTSRDGDVTELPRLFRNDLSRVVEITSFGVFTTEQPPLTTRHESLKTRDGVTVRASLPTPRVTYTSPPLPTTRVASTSPPLQNTRAPPSSPPLPITGGPPSLPPLPTTRVTPTSPPVPITRPPSPPSPYPTTRAPPTPSTQTSRTHAPSFEGGLRGPNATEWTAGLQRTPGGFRYVTSQEAAQSPNRSPTSFGGQGSSGVSGGTGFSTGLESTRVGGLGFSSSGAEASRGGGLGFSSTGAEASRGGGLGFSSTGSEASKGGGLPTGSDVSTRKGFPTASDIATGKWFPTVSDVSTGTGFPSGADISSGKWFPSRKDDVSREGELPTGVGVSFGSAFPSGSDRNTGTGSQLSTRPNASTGSDPPTGPDVSLEDGFPSGPDVSYAQEEEEDLNTVEVRIPDPRRMFFIPDSAAREAEMLNSAGETVLRIPLSPSRHRHGPMRFKGAGRGIEGRRPECPQCHPAFLLPDSCQPCVLIRR